MFLLINDLNKTVQYSKQLMCEDSGSVTRNLHPMRFRLTRLMALVLPVKAWAMFIPSVWKRYCPIPELSVKEGGIAPLGEQRDAFMFRSVETLAKKNKINLDKPIKDLSPAAMNILLYGNADGGSFEIRCGR
jgi:excinuclease ABC subunit A